MNGGEGYKPLDNEARTNIAGLIKQVETVGDAVGPWSHKAEARRTGASMHFRFDNEVDVQTSLRFVAIVNDSAPKLLSAARRLLAADAELARYRTALGLACSDGWSDGEAAMASYLETADTHNNIPAPTPSPSPVSVLGEIEARHAHPAGGQ